MKTKKKLTKRQMCVAIGRDVIKQLNDKRMIAESGIYYNGPAIDVGVEAQPILRAITKHKPCTVCAIGAGIVSAVCLYDNYRGGTPSNQSVITEKLKEFFSIAEIRRMEGVFETGLYSYEFMDLSDNLRMRFVWGWVIKHKGRFVKTGLHLAAARYAKRHG